MPPSSDEVVASLERVADRMSALAVPDPNAEPFFELLSGGLVWKDEMTHDLAVTNALRVLWNYRTGLLLGEPPPQWEAAWARANQLFPAWIGFLPERCTPTPELTAKARDLKRKGNREIEKCERLMRRQEWREAHGGTKP